MEHEHLKFFANSARGRDEMFYPNLEQGGADNGQVFSSGKSASEKHIDIVEYLKSLPRDMRATFVDIKKVLNIDLESELSVLDMIKNNSKIDIEETPDHLLSFQYRAKYEIRNKSDLIRTIERVRTGVLLSDIQDCYPNMEHQVREMIVAGKIIACKNSEKKTTVLYPRGKPFLTTLPGTVTAHPGKQMIATSESLCNAIRRGDAICVGESWFRVSPATAQAHVAERAKAPLSVTSDKELSKRNVYSEIFSDVALPLDGDYDGDDMFVGQALRHGCSNDIRQLWANTAPKIIPFVGRERELTSELLRYKLITRVGAEDYRPTHGSRIVNATTKTMRKRRATSAGNGQNAHLVGTNLEFLAT